MLFNGTDRQQQDGCRRDRIANLRSGEVLVSTTHDSDITPAGAPAYLTPQGIRHRRDVPTDELDHPLNGAFRVFARIIIIVVRNFMSAGVTAEHLELSHHVCYMPRYLDKSTGPYETRVPYSRRSRL